MYQFQPVTIILIIINALVSFKGFNNASFFEGYMFEVDKILLRKDYLRIVSSGFLHLSWIHLLFNMYVLFAFGYTMESTIGSLPFLLIYFASLIGGNLLSLFIHRHHGDYSAAGASGAICGIIFAYIAIFPGAGINIFFLPLSIPGWIYGLLFVLFSVYGIRSSRQTVGHDAHLGGALVGMATAILLRPYILVYNYLPIICFAIPAIAFFYFIVKRPHFLLIGNEHRKMETAYYTVDDRYNADKNRKQREMDDILEKIGRKGMQGLSKLEKEKLDEYSRNLN